MIAELARFSLGRAFLHLIAMLGDRGVRFHAAGIARELSSVAGATASWAAACGRSNSLMSSDTETRTR